MAKFTDAIVADLKGRFNAGDQPTENDFATWITAIQEGIEEHNHDATGDGDGMKLDWDEIWSDAVHDHSAAGEGGATLGFTAMTGVGVDVPNGWYLGVGAALERIVFDAAGDITVMGAKFAVGTLTPTQILVLEDASGQSPTLLLTETGAESIGIRNDATANALRFMTTNGGALGTKTVMLQDGRWGFGVLNPAYKIVVGGIANPNLQILSTTDAGICSLLFGDASSAALGRLRYDHSANKMQLYTNGAVALEASSAGVIKIANLAGVGTRNVSADANGNLVIA